MTLPYYRLYKVKNCIDLHLKNYILLAEIKRFKLKEIGA